ncbi:ABC transporter substrate-binding protein [Caldimonas brevitalea]|uniref:Amino acid ABC transporter substrate-binding protein n=1 Tax=Caldimonas brevitalea TaxID=413882 RepID=A0A0G3BVG6_9BURK|nr:ABC transporter substrate-binding protein [Caldimonas brevitalea]AKJ31361.1 amino acid ABC transporter substrate-binding protein [Caldimonas brevitalea]
MSFKHWGGWALVLALTQALAGAAAAQVLIGQTAGFSGPVAAGVKETTDGARLYFDAVNERGGVYGQKIELVSLDDKFEPKLAAVNAQKLIVEQKVSAMFLTRGTPHTQAVAPLLAEHRVPLVGPSTGAVVLHDPVHPYIFNVRATYQREAERAVRHLSLIGIDRIAVVHVDDSFGADALAGAMRGFNAVSKQPVLVEKYDRSKPDFMLLVPRIVGANSQAVLFIGAAAALVDGTRALRTAGSRAQVVTLSNNASAGFIKQMGDLAHGTIVTQVFPYERSVAAPLVKEALDLVRSKGGTEVSPAMMEGFASAKVLVEALRRAGPQPSRDKIVAALHSLRKYDLGGMEISYTPADHSGLDYADLSIVDSNGRFRR